jgi:perosamine synthetase
MHNAKLLVDACQAFGSNLVAANKFLSAGHHLCFSFGMPKLVSTGLGGCIVTNSQYVNTSLREIQNQGLSRPDIQSPGSFASRNGFNFKLTDIQSTLGVSQMLDINQILLRHRKTLQIYDNRLGIQFDITRSVMRNDELPLRAEIMLNDPAHLSSTLLKNGIQSSLRTDNIINHPFYRETCNYSDLSNSEKYSNSILVLPSGPMQSENSIHHVCDILESIVK